METQIFKNINNVFLKHLTFVVELLWVFVNEAWELRRLIT